MQTMGVIIGNRDFFPDFLVSQFQKDRFLIADEAAGAVSVSRRRRERLVGHPRDAVARLYGSRSPHWRHLSGNRSRQTELTTVRLSLRARAA